MEGNSLSICFFFFLRCIWNIHTSNEVKVIANCSFFAADDAILTDKRRLPFLLYIVLIVVIPLQLGPLVVPHSSAALLRTGRHRHTGRPDGSQIHSPAKGGYLSKLLPLHVFQRQSSTPWGKCMSTLDLIIYVAHSDLGAFNIVSACNSHHKVALSSARSVVPWRPSEMP